MILDGGDCAVGLESTIIDVSDKIPVVLRPGGVSAEAIQDVLGTSVESYEGEAASEGFTPKAPGLLLSHYAPDAPVRLHAKDVRDGEVLLGFGRTDDARLNLSPKGDLVEAASNLFAMLHQLDAMNVAGIAVSPIPNEGLGIAINDRLKRAAAPRN